MAVSICRCKAILLRDIAEGKKNSKTNFIALIVTVIKLSCKKFHSYNE